MSPELEALGRRAVACPGWKWLRGCPWERQPSGGWGVADGMFPPPDGALPDLSEPAGVGCLAALAREALGEPGAYAAHYNGSWTIERDDGAESEGYHDGGDWGLNGSGDFISEPSEPAAWVAALEAAGRK